MRLRKEKWFTNMGMRAFVQCQQLAIERTSHQKSSFASVKFAKTVTINHKTIRPQDANMFDLVAFRRNVKEFTQFDNTGPLLTNSASETCPPPAGFRVIGWFKPSKVEKDSSVEVHEFHIVAIEPVCKPLSEAALRLRYPRPPSPPASSIAITDDC